MSDNTEAVSPKAEDKLVRLEIFNYLREGRKPRSVREIADAVHISVKEAQHHCDWLLTNAPVEYIPTAGALWGFSLKKI